VADPADAGRAVREVYDLRTRLAAWPPRAAGPRRRTGGCGARERAGRPRVRLGGGAARVQ